MTHNTISEPLVREAVIICLKQKGKLITDIENKRSRKYDGDKAQQKYRPAYAGLAYLEDRLQRALRGAVFFVDQNHHQSVSKKKLALVPRIRRSGFTPRNNSMVPEAVVYAPTRSKICWNSFLLQCRKVQARLV